MIKFYFLFFIIFNLNASTVGLLDTGLDIKHKFIENKVWINQLEVANKIDDDNNGLIDDLNGWNIIENNNHLFQEEWRNRFNEDFYTYYQIRKKKTLNTATEEELNWYSEKRKDTEFVKELSYFRKYIHGTHVGGLVLGINNKVEQIGEIDVLPMVYLGEAQDGIAKSPEFTALKKGSELDRINHIRKFVIQYSLWQKEKLLYAISYLKDKVQIINGSFGTSMNSLEANVEDYYKIEFEKEIDIELKQELSAFFMNSILQGAKNVFDMHESILFIFSAGNKKTNNDEVSHFPSDAKSENVISVGASDTQGKLAYFSNYGFKSVHLLAPGIAIESSVSENRTLPINGTSQAAPQVSNLAANLVNILGHKKEPTLIKKIICELSDPNHQTMCGVINIERSVYMAKKLIDRMPYPRAKELAFEKYPIMDNITPVSNLNSYPEIEDLLE